MISLTHCLCRLLVPHIDLNKDSFITAKELEVWVRDKYESLLDTDDVDAVFREADIDFDNEVTWSEYLWRHFGIRDNGKCFSDICIKVYRGVYA